MSIVTRGFVDGTLVTGGFGGLFDQIVNYFRDGWYRRKKGYGARLRLLNITIKGNTSIPFSVKHAISGNFNNPYQKIYSILGNNKIAAKESLNVKGNYKKQLLYETKTTGKKNFFKIIYELLLDDD